MLVKPLRSFRRTILCGGCWFDGRLDVALRQVHSPRVYGDHFLGSIGRSRALGRLSAGDISLESSTSSGFGGHSLFIGGTVRPRTAAHVQWRHRHPSRDALGRDRSGCICLNGYGGLQDFSIWNRPATTALPEGYSSSQAAFAILHIKAASPVTKLIEGPFPVLKIYDQGLQGEGYRRGGFEGFPRFQKCVFKGEYPFGEAAISDTSLPLQVSLTAWNPFIPLDDKNSGIPCAILEYTFHNSSPKAVEYEFSYHLSHLAPGCGEDRRQAATQ